MKHPSLLVSKINVQAESYYVGYGPLQICKFALYKLGGKWTADEKCGGVQDVVTGIIEI